jgi:hypothetical protein
MIFPPRFQASIPPRRSAFPTGRRDDSSGAYKQRSRLALGLRPARPSSDDWRIKQEQLI